METVKIDESGWVQTVIPDAPKKSRRGGKRAGSGRKKSATAKIFTY